MKACWLVVGVGTLFKSIVRKDHDFWLALVSSESEEAKLIWKPQNRTDVDLETAQKLMKLIDTLEEDDDVQTVTHNFDVPEEIAAQL